MGPPATTGSGHREIRRAEDTGWRRRLDPGAIIVVASLIGLTGINSRNPTTGSGNIEVTGTTGKSEDVDRLRGGLPRFGAR